MRGREGEKEKLSRGRSAKIKGRRPAEERGGREGWSTKKKGRNSRIRYSKSITVQQKFMIQDSFIAYAEHFRSLVNYG